MWEDGLLSKILRESHFQVECAVATINSYEEKKHKAPYSQPTIIQKWIVLDGALNPTWVDNMNTLLDEERKLALASGEKIQLDDETTLIFEMTDLSNASPSMLTRSALVHLGCETVQWKSLITSWCNNAKQVWVITTSR